MAWGYLFLAAAFEIVWALGLKYSHGLTKFWPSVLTIVAMVLSFSFLAMAVRTIPLGTGYATWTGIGAVGTAILGITLLHEPASPARLAFLALMIVALVGVKMTSAH